MDGNLILDNSSILVVEDCASTATILAQALKKLGDVHLASSAKRATELVHSNQFDLILLDINLPDKSGIET